MNKSLLLIFAFAYSLALSPNTFAQIKNTGSWSEVGNVILSIVKDDADNNDGIGDGAIFVDGQTPPNTSIAGQGVVFNINGKLSAGETISISTYTYNRNSSFVEFKVQLWDVTANELLDEKKETINGTSSTSTARLTSLSYISPLSAVDRRMQLRFVRVDDGNSARNFAIDSVIINSSLIAACDFSVPDIFSNQSASLPTLNLDLTQSENEINQILDRYSDDYLGTSAPTSTELNDANAKYNALNISVGNYSISGNQIASFDKLSFLKTYAQQLKANPSDATTKENFVNTVWLASQQSCEGTLSEDVAQAYHYMYFGRPAALQHEQLPTNVRRLFAYTLYKNANFDSLNQFDIFWAPTYDQQYQQDHNSISSDAIYTLADIMLAYVKWQDTPQKREQYMAGFKRYLERFLSYSSGTSDGLKPDGSGFHHWAAYNEYMYSYNAIADLLSYLQGSNFQVDQSGYNRFRNALYYQYAQANDAGVQALSTAGRHPETRTRQASEEALKKTAMAGGEILGLATADPIFAGLYNRLYGVDNEFNYSTIADFNEGFFQFNHASAGAHRRGNWLVFTKGFTSNMWGSEIYKEENRFGRYQSYGALEIIYPGDLAANGFDVKTWDWNYNPGTTVIHLPWDDLQAEWTRIDELQQKTFAGALSFKNSGAALLPSTQGHYGMFAMNFQEKEGLGWGTSVHNNTHNATFTFKKSSFFFDDMIVALGSNITNAGTVNPTVTTLFQRMDNTANAALVDGVTQTSTGEFTFDGSANHWVISNYGTGFYLPAGGHTLKIKHGAQDPHAFSTAKDEYKDLSTPPKTYFVGYLDHGVTPNDQGYEYIVVPSASSTAMQNLHAAIQSGAKPYVVHRKDTNAHIIEYPEKKIFGFAFFNALENIQYGYLKAIDTPALLMHQYDANTETLLLSIANPDIGYASRNNRPASAKSIEVTLTGSWNLPPNYANVSIQSSGNNETILTFDLIDGLPIEITLNHLSNAG